MPKFSGTHFLKRGGGEVEVRPHSVPSVFLTGKRLFQARATKARASLPCFSNVAPKSPLAPFLYPGNRCKQQTPSPLPPLQSPDKKNTRPKKGEQRRKRVWVGGWVFTPSPKATHKKGENVYRLKDASPFLPPPSLTSEWDGGEAYERRKKARHLPMFFS